MPIVPRYEQQVQTTALQTPRAQALGPDAFGAGIAKGLQHVSDKLFEAAKEQSVKESLTALNEGKIKVLDSTRKLVNGYTDEQGVMQPGLIHAEGEDAKGLEAKYKSAFDEFIGEAKKNLQGHPNAEVLFDHWAQELYIKHATELHAHEFDATNKAAIASTDAMAKTDRDVAIQSYLTSGQIDEKNFVKSLNDLATLRHYTPEQRTQFVAEGSSSLYTSAIKADLASGQTEKAVATFNALKGKLTAPDLLDLQPKVQEQVDNDTGVDFAKKAFDDHMQGVTVDQVAPRDEMLDAVRGDATLNKKQKEVAEMKVAEYVREREQKVHADTINFSNDLSRKVQNGMGYASALREVNNAPQVPSQAKDNLRDFLDHRFHISEQRAEAKAEAKTQRQLKQLSALLTFQTQYLNGDYKGPITPELVRAKAGEFGAFTDDAMRFVANVNKDLGKAKLDDEDLKNTIRILRQNGQYANLLPDVDSANETDKAKLALLRGSVLQHLHAAESRGPGKGVSLKQALQWSIQGVDTGPGWFSTREPLYVLGSDLASDAGKDPSTWPVATQNKVIEDAFYRNPQNAGKSLTDQQREVYRKKLLGGEK